MKTLITHLIAVAIGVVAAHLLRTTSDNEKVLPVETKRSERLERGLADSINPPPEGTASHMHPRRLEAELSKKITISDLQQWLERKKGDSHSLAEAQAIAGLLTDNPDLIRQAIEADPENPHLLYIGATLSSFSTEERLALSERFFLQDTGNGLAAYLYAAQLFEAGDTTKGIDILRSSPDRPRIDAFATRTQLLMDDAYVAAGYSTGAAKIQSVANLSLPYYSSLWSLVSSINGLGSSLPSDEAADLRSLTATMGIRLAHQVRSGSFIGHLMGLKLEEQTLLGLAENSPSPYEGLTVEQARLAITNEREELRKTMKQAPGLEEIMSSSPELVDRYIDRFRLMGELEATKWWLDTTTEQK
jgi:hypothetical protein